METLEAKAVLDMAKADLDYYDKIIEISRARLKAGDIAQIDFDRIELVACAVRVGAADGHR